MASKTNACRILDQLRIPYALHEYEWDEEQLDAVTVAAKVGLPPEQLFKTLVLRGDKTGILMACIPGDKELHLKSLATASGNKKIEMVPVKEIQSLTGYIRGGVSPLGSKKKYPLFLDRSAVHLHPISISAGRRGLQIFMKGTDLEVAAEAKLADLAQ
ncbi:Cys-tRNA(Pro) deacylase [Paenibacillus allorhizosphaerae]|uniref:Cys-tRNA(Pro)/Cys-tRNA(Cys) deacylase n=1 Tax=Paenibacillus allorhizosphaerae TaxID=2849866 RepID=A0ABN7TCB8_9BACL|nr:Cys-tRNA(Pro) deacylase [Paenibacillus allorhizosphaerae]CAG7621849.1 Cys-tRNA(Pro)/Cys-tRNA(Cys) deacylase YbaK [Paenibacillus allorhizosphaerae]